MSAEAVEGAKQTMDSAKTTLDRAYNTAYSTGDRDDRAAHEQAAAAHRQAVEKYQDTLFDHGLQEGRERHAAKVAEREAFRAEEIRQRGAAAEASLAEAAKQDEKYGRLPGESAEAWVARAKAESRATHVPGKLGQKDRVPVAAVEALQREGAGARTAAAGGAGPKQATKGRMRGW